MSPPMTMDERIEAAARAIALDLGWEPREVAAMFTPPYSDPYKDLAGSFTDSARVAIAAAFPDLQGDRPAHVIAPHQVETLDVYKELVEGTHWLAPWESDGEMDDAAHKAAGHKWVGTEPMVLWSAMRDAYLSKGGGE